MDEIALYILMRADIASMSSAKKCAQAARAAVICVEGLPLDNSMRNGWGCARMLHIHEAEMRSLVAQMCKIGIHAGIVHDPEYRFTDGLVTHSIPLDTCAFVFGEKARIEPYLRHVPPMP